MIRHRSALVIGLVVPAVLLAGALYVAWARTRQEQLNRALIAAVREHDAAQVTTLLTQGADANARDGAGRAPSWWRHALVLLHALKPAVRRGPTALQLASERWDVASARVLLDHGANPNARDGEGQTPIYMMGEAADAPGEPLVPQSKRDEHDLLQLLLARGADPNAIPRRELAGLGTPLQCAAAAGDVEALRMLLDHRADPNLYGTQEGSPLQDAISEGHTEAAMLLLQRGADPNARDNHAGTALLDAASEGNLVLVRALLARGADVNADSRYGYTPLSVARKPAITALLLAHGARVNVSERWDVTPLMNCAEDAPVECVRLLLSHGARVNEVDAHEETALQKAADAGRADVVALLLRHGARVNVEDMEGRTPVAVARLNKHLDVVRLLERAGALEGSEYEAYHARHVRHLGRVPSFGGAARARS